MIPLAFVGVAFIVMPFAQGRSGELRLVALCLIVGTGSLMLVVYTLLSLFRTRIEIYPDKIRSVGPLRTRELLIDQISGFRILPGHNCRTLHLEPKDPGTEEIEINLVLEREADLLEWLNRNLTNFDAADFDQEMKQ